MPTLKLVWVHSTVTTWRPRSSGSIPPGGAPQEHGLPAACSWGQGKPEAVMGVTCLWKSRACVSSLGKLVPVQFSQRRLLLLSAGRVSQQHTQKTGDFTYGQLYKTQSSRKTKRWDLRYARRLPVTQYSVWVNNSNCTIKVSFLGIY